MEKILIVEDESIIALELQTRIKSFGYKVVGTADRGSIAIEKSQKLKPDLILMDINLKGDLDGIETTEEILKLQKLPIIFLTAFSDRATTDRVKKTNTYGLLFKPFSDKELQATIDLALYKFKMELAVFEREEALKLSEEKFKKITHSSLDIIFIIDKSGNQLFFNDRIESLLGYKPDELIGIRFTRYIPYDEIKKFFIQVENIYKNKSVSQFTTKIFHKDGHLVDVEINGTLVKHQNDYVIQGTIRDISERVKSQELIIESQRSYLSLFNSVSESIYIHGLDGVFLDVNKGAEKMYGYTRQELIGKTPEFVSAPGKNDMESVVEILKQVFETGVSATFEFWGKRKDGSIFPKEVVSNKCKYFGKDVIISTARDITERKKAESALKESENKYRQFLYLSIDCIYMFDAETKKIVDANDSFLNLLGYNINDVKHLTAYNIIAHDKTSIDAYVDNILTNGVTKIGERNWKHKDGHLIPMEVTSNKMRVGGKNIIFIVARNISELKKANEKLLQSEQLYHDLVETAQDLIWRCDEEARYVYLNPAWEDVLGYKIEEMLGRRFTEFQTKENAERDIHTFSNLLKDKIIKGYESIHQHKNGNEVTLLFNAKVIISSDGKVLGTHGTAYDITERKKLEEQTIIKNNELEKLNHEKDLLFSIIAHDLQSPFHGLIGITGLMAENISSFSKEEIQTYARTINSTISNTSNLLCNLLEWAKLQLGIRELMLEKINLHNLVCEVLGLLENQAKYKEITIKNHLPENVYVDADQKMIRSVFINLVSNAIKFTNKRGQINISSISTSENILQVLVSDNGIGMNTEMCQNIFEPTRKSGRSGTEGEPSSGIGLMLCKEFINRHNGKIWAESKENEGTTFYFTLPIAK